MNPREFRDVAASLASSSGAGYRRSALSRSYYAVYHVAWELLYSLGFNLGQQHDAHQTVRDYLARGNVTAVIHVGAQLRDLHNLRVKADYRLRDPHPEQEAVVAAWIAHASRMIAALDAAAADPLARERMTGALQAWEQGRGRPNR